MRERNSEGYHDPTAERAIVKADRYLRRRNKTKSKSRVISLTYLIGELPSFQKVLKDFRKQGRTW